MTDNNNIPSLSDGDGSLQDGLSATLYRNSQAPDKDNDRQTTEALKRHLAALDEEIEERRHTRIALRQRLGEWSEKGVAVLEQATKQEKNSWSKRKERELDVLVRNRGEVEETQHRRQQLEAAMRQRIAMLDALEIRLAEEAAIAADNVSRHSARFSDLLQEHQTTARSVKDLDRARSHLLADADGLLETNMNELPSKLLERIREAQDAKHSDRKAALERNLMNVQSEYDTLLKEMHAHAALSRMDVQRAESPPTTSPDAHDQLEEQALPLADRGSSNRAAGRISTESDAAVRECLDRLSDEVRDRVKATTENMAGMRHERAWLGQLSASAPWNGIAQRVVQVSERWASEQEDKHDAVIRALLKQVQALESKRKNQLGASRVTQAERQIAHELMTEILDEEATSVATEAHQTVANAEDAWNRGLVTLLLWRRHFRKRLGAIEADSTLLARMFEEGARTGAPDDERAAVFMAGVMKDLRRHRTLRERFLSPWHRQPPSEAHLTNTTNDDRTRLPVAQSIHWSPFSGDASAPGNQYRLFQQCGHGHVSGMDRIAYSDTWLKVRGASADEQMVLLDCDSDEEEDYLWRKQEEWARLERAKRSDPIEGTRAPLTWLGDTGDAQIRAAQAAGIGTVLDDRRSAVYQQVFDTAAGTAQDGRSKHRPETAEELLAAPPVLDTSVVADRAARNAGGSSTLAQLLAVEGTLRLYDLQRRQREQIVMTSAKTLGADADVGDKGAQGDTRVADYDSGVATTMPGAQDLRETLGFGRSTRETLIVPRQVQVAYTAQGASAHEAATAKDHFPMRRGNTLDTVPLRFVGEETPWLEADEDCPEHLQVVGDTHDVLRGYHVMRLPTGLGGVSAMATSVVPAARVSLVLAGTTMGSLCLWSVPWDAHTATILVRAVPPLPRAERRPVSALSFSADGVGQVVSLDELGTARVWSLEPLSGGAGRKAGKHSATMFPKRFVDFSPAVPACTTYLNWESYVRPTQFEAPKTLRKRIYGSQGKHKKYLQNRLRASAAAFHPSMSVTGRHPSIVVGLEDGTVMKWNSDYDEGNAAARVAYLPAPASSEPTPEIDPGVFVISSRQENRGNHVQREFFHLHRAPILFVGFLEFLRPLMITVDVCGVLALWPYATEHFSEQVWYTPERVLRLDLVDFRIGDPKTAGRKHTTVYERPVEMLWADETAVSRALADLGYEDNKTDEGHSIGATHLPLEQQQRRERRRQHHQQQADYEKYYRAQALRATEFETESEAEAFWAWTTAQDMLKGRKPSKWGLVDPYLEPMHQTHRLHHEDELSETISYWDFMQFNDQASGGAGTTQHSQPTEKSFADASSLSNTSHVSRPDAAGLGGGGLPADIQTALRRGAPAGTKYIQEYHPLDPRLSSLVHILYRGEQAEVLRHDIVDVPVTQYQGRLLDAQQTSSGRELLLLVLHEQAPDDHRLSILTLDIKSLTLRLPLIEVELGSRMETVVMRVSPVWNTFRSDFVLLLVNGNLRFFALRTGQEVCSLSGYPLRPLRQHRGADLKTAIFEVCPMLRIMAFGSPEAGEILSFSLSDEMLQSLSDPDDETRPVGHASAGAGRETQEEQGKDETEPEMPQEKDANDEKDTDRVGATGEEKEKEEEKATKADDGAEQATPYGPAAEEASSSQRQADKKNRSGKKRVRTKRGQRAPELVFEAELPVISLQANRQYDVPTGPYVRLLDEDDGLAVDLEPVVAPDLEPVQETAAERESKQVRKEVEGVLDSLAHNVLLKVAWQEEMESLGQPFGVLPPTHLSAPMQSLSPSVLSSLPLSHGAAVVDEDALIGPMAERNGAVPTDGQKQPRTQPQQYPADVSDAEAGDSSDEEQDHDLLVVRQAWVQQSAALVPSAQEAAVLLRLEEEWNRVVEEELTS